MKIDFDKLKDIRDLENIPDISFYFFLASIFVGILSIFTLFYVLLRFYKNRKKTTLKQRVLKRLKEIDFSDSKKAAYLITRYGRFVANDERSQKILQQLTTRLEKYKYIKNPPKFDEQDIKYYDLFIGALDE